MVTSISSLSFSRIADLRLGEIKSKIQSLESRMGVQKPVEVKFCPFAESPHALLRENVIQLPSWFLLRYDDIPERFRLASVDDPRVTNQDFLNDLAGWINGKLQEAGISHLVRPADYGILQSTIMMLRDPELFEKSKDFILGHELAHLNHTQVEQSKFYSDKVQEAVFGGGLIGGILLLVLSVSLLPYIPIVISLVAGGIGLALSIGSCVNALKTPASTSEINAVAEEKHADLDSADALQDARGGIYRFDTLRIHHLGIRRTNPSMRDRIDEHGNNIGDTKHPSLTERIAYLRQWQAQRA